MFNHQSSNVLYLSLVCRTRVKRSQACFFFEAATWVVFEKVSENVHCYYYHFFREIFEPASSLS